MEYREFSIPKKGGKVRKIVAPDPELKTYLKVHLKDLTTYFFKYSKMYRVLDNMHGFIPKKNVKSAAKKHIGYDITLMMDISKFFDSVTAQHIPRIKEVKPEMFHADGYAAQGFPTSPMLANIAVIPIIAKIKQQLTAKLGKDFALTIYADDIQVSYMNVPLEKQELVDIISSAFEEKGLAINKNKTRFKYAKYGERRILGINVSDTLKPTRKTLRKIRAAKHQNNGPSLGGLTTWSRYISQ